MIDWLNRRFALAGFVEHIPGPDRTIHSGHYVAYIKHGEAWKYCNDRDVTNVTEIEALRAARNAYIVYFQETTTPTS